MGSGEVAECLLGVAVYNSEVLSTAQTGVDRVVSKPLPQLLAGQIPSIAPRTRGLLTAWLQGNRGQVELEI